MDYAAEVRQICAAAQQEDPHLVAVAKVIPAVGERLRTQTAVMEAGQKAVLARLDRMEERIEGQMRETQLAVTDFTEGHFTLQFTPRRTRLLPQGLDPRLLRPRPVSPSPADRRRREGRLSASPPPGPPALCLAGPAPARPHPIEAAAAAAAAADARVPQYKLSREISTVPDLWREWTVGLAGLPSVEELDRRYGSKWRPRGEV